MAADPRTVKVKHIFNGRIDPYHGYSNELERPNLDSCDGFKSKKKPLASRDFHKKFSRVLVR